VFFLNTVQKKKHKNVKIPENSPQPVNPQQKSNAAFDSV